VPILTFHGGDIVPQSHSPLVLEGYKSRLAGAAIALAVVVAGLVGFSAAPAGAATLQCGDVITQDTSVDNDIVCTAAGAFGVVIGADNITVHFNRHKITGAGATGLGSIGITDDGVERTGITVRGADIEGFDTGVQLQAADSNVWGMTFTSTDIGALVFGQNNYIFANTMASAGTIGFAIEGDGSQLWGNSVTGGPDDGIAVSGDNVRIIRNRVLGCTFNGIAASEYTTFAKLAQNTVTGCDIGITITGQNGRVQSSDVSGNCDGLFVSDPTAVVWRNNAHDNCASGIFIDLPGALVAENTATDNGGVGISAPDGTIDAGGNVASGNLLGDCVTVVCALPAP
jgi:nitrous oxidase accessory protein NosD